MLKRRTTLMAMLGLSVFSGKNAAAQTCPAKDEPLNFEVYPDPAGKWRWRLFAGNGDIIADSGQGYTSKPACDHGISRVKQSSCASITEKQQEE